MYVGRFVILIILIPQILYVSLIMGLNIGETDSFFTLILTKDHSRSLHGAQQWEIESSEFTSSSQQSSHKEWQHRLQS